MTIKSQQNQSEFIGEYTNTFLKPAPNMIKGDSSSPVINIYYPGCILSPQVACLSTITETLALTGEHAARKVTKNMFTGVTTDYGRWYSKRDTVTVTYSKRVTKCIYYAVFVGPSHSSNTPTTAPEPQIENIIPVKEKYILKGNYLYPLRDSINPTYSKINVN